MANSVSKSIVSFSATYITDMLSHVIILASQILFLLLQEASAFCHVYQIILPE